MANLLAPEIPSNAISGRPSFTKMANDSTVQNPSHERLTNSEYQVESKRPGDNVSMFDDIQTTNDVVDNPRQWSLTKKTAVVFFAMYSAFVATSGTAMYVAAIPAIQQQFEISTTLAIAPASLYAYGLGIGALIGTAACEIYGRAIVYRSTIPIAFIFTIVGAVSHNFTTLAVSRTISGLASGPCLTVGVGTLNDLWDVSLEKTGTTFAVLLLLSIIWSTQGVPMVSASLMTYHGWRWTFWASAILVGINMVLAFVTPESYHPVLVRKRAMKLGLPVPPQEDSWKLFLIAVGRPIHMMIVEPIVVPTGMVLAITQSVVYCFYISYALLFEEVYGFTQYQSGMTFGALVIGSILALPVAALFDKLTYQKAREEAIRLGKKVDPEHRLYPTMLSSFTTPISVFWLAWTGRKSVHWIVPVLSGVLFGFSYVLNTLSLPVYNNDIYGIHLGASTLAASTFLRFIISGNFPLFTPQMVHKLGFPWAMTLLGFVTVAMIPIPWVFYKWGPILRSKSRYLKTSG